MEWKYGLKSVTQKVPSDAHRSLKHDVALSAFNGKQPRTQTHTQARLNEISWQPDCRNKPFPKKAEEVLVQWTRKKRVLNTCEKYATKTPLNKVRGRDALWYQILWRKLLVHSTKKLILSKMFSFNYKMAVLFTFAVILKGATVLAL